MKTNPGALLVLVLGLCLGTPGGAAAPFAFSGPGVNAGDFQITTFASGLNYPKGMQLLADGSLLVATSVPRAGTSSFYSSTGTLVRLVDADGDGVADSPPQVLFSGLPGSLSGLKAAGGLVFVASTASRISVLRLGAAPDDPLTLAGKIDFGLPNGWLHPPSDLAVRPAPGEAGVFELYFQLGSFSNNTFTTHTATISSDLGLSATLQGDSIYRVRIADLGDSVTASDATRIARGLRNPAGLAFQPGTGDLYFEDNGIDGLSDPNEPFSADELNAIPSADLGGAVVEDFGFPGSYTAYRSGTVVGGMGIQPLVAFEPLPDPFTGSESEGPAEIAFAPPGFPEAMRGGIFIGFHGKFNLGGIANEENPMVYVDLGTLDYFHAIGNAEPGIGHLDGLLASADTLFLADLASNGSVSNGAGTGKIYAIRALPPAPVFVRGDANGDRALDVSDAVAFLGFLFLEGSELSCPDAADANDDGELDLSDAVAVLLHLFAEGYELPGPANAPGPDPTPDSLGCRA